MLALLFLLSTLASVPGDALAAPTIPASPYSTGGFTDRDAIDRPSHWKGAACQIAPGLVGGLIGSMVGAVVGAGLGGLVGGTAGGGGTQSDPDKDPPLISDRLAAALFGMVVGAGIGEGLGTGLLVHLSADPDRPSRGVLLPMLGGVVGFAAGAYAISQAMGNDPGGWIVLGGIAGSSLGAITLDRLTSRDWRDVQISTWSPRKGVDGLRMSLAF
jgi:hypothetical protein